MKKFMMLFICLFILAGCGHMATKETVQKTADYDEMTLCNMAHDKAMSENRVFLDESSNTFYEIPKVGECDTDEIGTGCIVDETINMCGWIAQKMELNNNMYGVLYQPVFDDNYNDIYFLIYSIIEFPKESCI